MSSPVCDEELLSSIVPFSPALSLKSGTLDILHNSDPTSIEVIATPEPTFENKPSASGTPIVKTDPTSSTLKTRHSSTPSPKNLLMTIDNVTYTVSTRSKYNILEDPVFIDSGILPPVFNPVKNFSQSNTLTDELLRTHLNFKTNFSSLNMTPTTYKFRYPQDRNFDHYGAYASKNFE